MDTPLSPAALASGSASKSESNNQPQPAAQVFSAFLRRHLEKYPLPTPEQAEEHRQAALAERARRDRAAAAWELDALAGEVGDRLADATLDSFVVSPKFAREQRAVLQALREYADDLAANVEDGRGIWLQGPAGTGKDHCLVALARIAIADCGFGVAWDGTRASGEGRASGPCIRYVSGGQLFGAFRAAMNSGSEDDLVGRYASPAILILSDPLPPLGALTPFQAQMLLEVVDERNTRRRATWVSINADRSEADGRMGAPIVDRLQQDALVLTCNWPSWRTQKVRE